ncbi:MAG TPA: hypothetical protein VJ646_09570 [Candidatus Binatia bacterium]|nr:hypothetical protein [Candidatus Binatia bacterium]
MNRLGFSTQAYSRVPEVRKAIADFAGSKDIHLAHITEAIQYRSLDRKA